jgi:class 3 adenylate cyclase
MAEWQKIIALVIGVIGIISTIVAVTRYLTKIQEQAERNKIAKENQDLAAALKDVESRRDQLLDQLALAGRAGNAALSRKAVLDERMQALMRTMGASGASLYVPVRNTRGEVQGLAFLCIEPFSRQTQQLKSRIIPLRSLAGSAFVRAAREVTVNPSQNPEHLESAQRIADYKPSTMLNVTLSWNGESVGLIQLLRKDGEPAFETADIARVAAQWDPIVEQVGEIAKNPEYLAALGLSGKADGAVGTVLYFDLSNSSVLFKELSADLALQTLNEYFEAMCAAAFAQGATIDNYMGDGGLLRFNLPLPRANHEFAAVTAALDMRIAFTRLRNEWIGLHARLSMLHHRVGVATGSLIQANLGHPQAQRPTLLGYPISVAAALCNVAPREGLPIIIDEETYRAVKGQVAIRPFSLVDHPKASGLVRTAYEII